MLQLTVSLCGKQRDFGKSVLSSNLHYEDKETLQATPWKGDVKQCKHYFSSFDLQTEMVSESTHSFSSTTNTTANTALQYIFALFD